jgi:hypothetical protein
MLPMLLNLASRDEFLEIFCIAWLVQVVTLLVRYMCKVRHLGDSRRKAATWPVHFECLRFGAELSLIGLATLLTIYDVALARNTASAQRVFVAMLITSNTLIWVQVGLLLVTTFITALWDDPQKSRHKGTIVPFLFGWLSLMISARVFVATIH